MQANLNMNTEVLERQLEQLRKDRDMLQHRLEAALGLRGPSMPVQSFLPQLNSECIFGHLHFILSVGHLL